MIHGDHHDPIDNYARFGKDMSRMRQIKKMGDTGLEPVTPSVSSWCSSQLS
jgi:hypothetical protein